MKHFVQSYPIKTPEVIRFGSVILSVLLMSAPDSSFGEADDSYAVFQRLMDIPVVVEPNPAVLELAKKKGNNRNRKNNRNRQRNKPVKIDASSKRTIRIGESRASKGNQLGGSARSRLRSLGESSADEQWYKDEQQRLALEQLNKGRERQIRDRKFMEEVKKRIFYGQDVNQKDAGGRTWLHAAVSNGFPESIRYLLEAGADKNLKDASGMTPSALAVLIGQSELVALLK